jgi:prepilin-type N-terminal cleavage/methylation domain-containing protein
MRATWKTAERRGRRGAVAFTFIEVMVAIAILALCLTVLLATQGRSVDLGAKANAADTAALLGQMKMEELILKAQKDGQDSLRDEERGEFDQEKYPSYRWEYKTDPVSLPIVPGGGVQENQLRIAQQFMEKAIRQLNLTVQWKENGRADKELTLTTHLVKLDFLPALTAAVPGGTGGGTP